jgi:hypothetical protein
MTDAPVTACMASQHAGWQVEAPPHFAMGSGPMRAAYGKEELFDHIPGREQLPSPSARWRRGGCLRRRSSATLRSG